MNSAAVPITSQGDNVVAFVDKRFKAVPLAWPVTFAGRRYDHINVKRMTVSEVGAFIEGLKDVDTTALARFPVFVEDDGVTPVPAAVLDGLDDDDSSQLDEELKSFLPKRLLAVLEAISSPDTCEPTAPMSGTSSDGPSPT